MSTSDVFYYLFAGTLTLILPARILWALIQSIRRNGFLWTLKTSGQSIAAVSLLFVGFLVALRLLVSL